MFYHNTTPILRDSFSAFHNLCPHFPNRATVTHQDHRGMLKLLL